MYFKSAFPCEACSIALNRCKYKTHAYKTLKTVGVQIIMLKHPTKHKRVKQHTDARQRFKHLITKLKHSEINFAETVVELRSHSNASGFKLHLTKNPNRMRGYVMRRMQTYQSKTSRVINKFINNCPISLRKYKPG